MSWKDKKDRGRDDLFGEGFSKKEEKKSCFDRIRGLISSIGEDLYRPREGEQGLGARARRLSRGVSWLYESVGQLEKCGSSGDLRLSRIKWLCVESFDRLSKLDSSSSREEWDLAVWLCEKLIEEVGDLLRGRVS